MARTRYDASLVSNVSPCAEADLRDPRDWSADQGAGRDFYPLGQQSIFPVISLCPR